MPGPDLGRDGGEFQWQLFDQGLSHRRLKPGGELGAADQARAIKADIEIAENVAWPQAARPFLESVEMPRGIGAADHGPDRGADHDIGVDAVGNQGPDNADMGKSARGAAAQHQPDHWPPDAAQPDLVAAVGAVLTAADQVFQHRGVSMDDASN